MTTGFDAPKNCHRVGAWLALCLLAQLLSGCRVSQRSQDLVTQSKAASVGDWKNLKLDGEPLLEEVKRSTAILCGPADGVRVESEATEAGLAVDISYHGRENFEMGSAVPVTRDGYFITASHCMDGPPMALLIFQVGADGTPQLSKFDARLVWRSTDWREFDLAVIHVPAKLRRHFTVRPLDRADLGDRVAVTGYSGLTDSKPFSASEAAGKITGLSRPKRFASGGIGQLISHDAPLTEGDSGGPLVDRYGRLIGINSRLSVRAIQLPMARSPEGLGYIGEAVAPEPDWLREIIEGDRRSRQ